MNKSKVEAITTLKTLSNKGETKMKLATNRYQVVIEGTKKSINYYGFKTKKEAQMWADKATEVHNIKQVVIDTKVNV